MDIGASLSCLDGDIDLLKEISAIFVADCPRLLSQIRQAITLGDSCALARAAHCLKGAVANLTAQEVTESARRLESMGEKGDLSHAEEAYNQLVERLERLIALIEKLMTGSSVA